MIHRIDTSHEIKAAFAEAGNELLTVAANQSTICLNADTIKHCHVLFGERVGTGEHHSAVLVHDAYRTQRATADIENIRSLVSRRQPLTEFRL